MSGTKRSETDDAQTKANNSTNDAIVDNAAGQAYVEQFALEVFQRAENAVHADKVSK